jgi:hypothetical protein
MAVDGIGAGEIEVGEIEAGDMVLGECAGRVLSICCALA